MKEKLKDARFNKTDWRELGGSLGLHKHTLNMISEDQRGDVNKCFTECLAKWLNRADDVDSKGKPTFSSLADALDKMDDCTPQAEYISKCITDHINILIIATLLLVVGCHLYMYMLAYNGEECRFNWWYCNVVI